MRETKNLFNKVFDYADTDIFYYEGDPLTSDFKSYQNCSFEVEYPEINKYRVMRVDIPNKLIWMRQVKGRAFDDDIHMKCPKYDTTKFIFAELGDDELDKNKQPITFPIPFTKIRVRFYENGNYNKENSLVYEEGF